MDYDQEYKPILDVILNQFDKGKIPDHSDEDTYIVGRLYDIITPTLVTARNMLRRGNINKQIVVGENMTVPHNSRYISETIRNSIMKNQRRQIIYKYNLDGRKIIISFGLMKGYERTDLEIDQYFISVCSWLIVCTKYAQNKCGQIQHVNIYLGGEKKIFPKSTVTTLGPINVNSGFSDICSHTNEIVVYRGEEWFKVFIHECFHSFGLEPSEINERRLSEYVKQILPIKPRVRVNEAYVECWARILNSAYASIYISSNRDDYLSLVRFSLLLESRFSIAQASRVLSFMNLTYHNILNKGDITAKTLYKEDTNVFAYYVITAALMFNPYRFLRWCSKNNTQWLRFNNNPAVVDRFEQLIHETMFDANFIGVNDSFSILPGKSVGLRMTIVESNNSKN